MNEILFWVSMGLCVGGAYWGSGSKFDTREFCYVILPGVVGGLLGGYITGLIWPGASGAMSIVGALAMVLAIRWLRRFRLL